MPREAYHHGDLKAAALAEAERMIETDPDFSMRQLAGQLGVAHRALYNHFGDRAGLLAQLAAAGFRQLAAATADADSVAAFITAYARFALARPRLYQLMMAQPYSAFERNPDLRAAADFLIGVALAVLAPGASDADTGRRQVMRYWMLVHGGLALHGGGVLRGRDDAGFIAELLAIAGLKG
ncbi:TetR/AcrR family transcriptional regulator [Sandarakinorhabdus oryzae]|uniref:TetR/AcrR family transcriptional regulator n=1 Tax=Sandarakinorhabdus oryzae TaxID=2675220 RepID=UPI0018CC787E|nr:WHG domain-containing protein [Sandarakinorhabdus oryzae]